MKPINPDLRNYLENSIIPQYDSFDKGHQRDHAHNVMDTALYLSQFYDVNAEMILTAAACHDLGLAEDRNTHHLVSGCIIRQDKTLRNWFSDNQIETIAQAAEDHRASSDREPRTIYGKIIAEADRQIIPEVVIRRTVQFGLSHYPELDKEGQWQRTLNHLHEKYAEGGYLKLWVQESPNAARLQELRNIIRDTPTLRRLFEETYNKEFGQN